MKTCSVEGCGRKVSARGLCNGHYFRVTRGLGLQPERKIGDCSGAYNSKWRGGTPKVVDGRTYVYSPNHPNRSKSGYVLRYRLVMEKHLGRYLSRSELVHHKNEDPTDDRLENLELTTRKGHGIIHAPDAIKRFQKLISFNGETLNICQWAKKIGIPKDTLYQRFQARWTIKRALTTPLIKGNQNG